MAVTFPAGIYYYQLDNKKIQLTKLAPKPPKPAKTIKLIEIL